MKITPGFRENTDRDDAREDKRFVRPAVTDVPEFGRALQVAEGVFWIRLPLDSQLGHVNVYALEDSDGWTLVDTGTNTQECRKVLHAAFAREPLSGKRIRRVLCTHHHPDHIGLAGVLVEPDTSLLVTRVGWSFARLLQMDDRKVPGPEQLEFFHRAGLNGLEMAAFARRMPSRYSETVAPLPLRFEALFQGQILRIGSRTWTVHLGNGHAAEHVTLWSSDGLAITGDQIMLGTASNLSVPYCEPYSDLVSEWIESCERLGRLASDSTLCLPGHNVPFRGITHRCQQIVENQRTVLERLLEALDRPRSAFDCLDTVYRRPLAAHERNALLSETVGFLNHLCSRGVAERQRSHEDVYLYRRIPSGSYRAN